jgi:pimeloyl-ACP methyl ester carboxylesterase
MTVSHIGTEGGRIAVEITGEGPLVVCLPGMGDLRSTYRFLAPALVAAGFRVATVDLRGHGDSDDHFSSFDDEAAARDFVTVVEQNGGTAILVGNSMAAGAAVLAAATRPELVRGLVLLGPFVRNPAGSRATELLMRVALLRPWGPLVWKSYYRSLLPGAKPADYARQESAMLAGIRRHWRSFVRTTRTSHEPAERALAHVTAPALVVMGTADADWKDPSAEAAWIGDQLSAEVLLVEGAGHYPMVQAPDQVNPAVVAFVQKVAASA